MNFSKKEKLHHLLENSAKRCPDNLVLDDLERVITYRELDAISSEIAESIKSILGNGTFRAAILFPKSIEYTALIFGILKAGGTYIPLDWEAPTQRNRFIIDNCEVSLVFTPDESDLEDFLVSFTKSRMSIQTHIAPIRVNVMELSVSRSGISAENPAYILYTSGSTGRPKGVMFSHSNALSFIHWCTEKFTPNPSSVFSSHAPFHFDLSILDLYLAVKHAAKVILIDIKTGKNPRALAHYIQEKKITHWYSTPTALKLILQYGKLDRFDHSSLQYVLFAGEVFPIVPLRKLTEIWTSARFFNLYGPTETNVCTYYEIPLPIDSTRTLPFPIGRVCEHLNARLSKKTSNQREELCISGPAVSIGYWNDPLKNEESFFTDGGTKWYRTGDCVTVDPKGNYIFAGRLDRMVKRNGFRIEPGEIENALHLNPAVNDAAILTSINSDFECNITAFIGGERSELLNENGLRAYCLEHLPHYMVPDEFYFLTLLPKTSTNKTDYQELKKFSNGL